MLDLDEMKALRDDIRHWPGGTAHRVVKALTELIEEVETQSQSVEFAVGTLTFLLEDEEAKGLRIDQVKELLRTVLLALK